MSNDANSMKCPYCGYVNLQGARLCEACSMPLPAPDSTSGENALSIIDEGAIKDLPTNMPVIGTEAGSETLSVTTDGASADLAEEASGDDRFTDSMLLQLYIEGPDEVLHLRPKQGWELSIGRSAPNAPRMPDIDLAAYGGHRLGISRRHAVLRLEAERLTIRDVGSSNGTMVNGARLTCDVPQVLRDGDQLRLGNLTFNVRFSREL